MNDLGVVVVTHDSEKLLPNCLAPLVGNPQIDVVVVDNHSRDESVAVASSFDVKILPLPKNAGFSYACNLGARFHGDQCSWLAFVNPDVVVSGSGLLRAVGDAPDMVAALSPLVLDPGGSPQSDIARPEPDVWGTAARYLLSGRADLRSRADARRLVRRPANSRYIETAVTSGACLLIRREMFDAVGGFDEAYFLNMEDVDLCCRVRGFGARIVIDTQVQAIHSKGTSSSSVSDDQRMFECGRAEIIFFERNRPTWETVVVAASVTVGCIGRSAFRHVWRTSSGGWMPLLAMYLRLAKEASGSVSRACGYSESAVSALPAFVPD